MSTFDIRQDAPGLLRAESLNVTISFNRTSPTTARIAWNIPSPAAGCTAENQAYCGMLVTLDTTPATISKSPVNGVQYAADPTASPTLFAGDKLDTAFVVGAFYGDRDTTFIDVTGLKPNTAYYVTGYPVDCQDRYFTAGVHAYSQDFKKDSSVSATSGMQTILLDESNGVQLTDVTGLVCGVFYEFQAQIGLIPKPQAPYRAGECVPQMASHTISVDGCEAATYQDLLNEINKRFALLDNPQQSATPPNTNGLYWNSSTQKLFTWDGYQHNEITNVIIQAADPSVVSDGVYWFDTTTGILKYRSGGVWTVSTVISFSTDPTQPLCDQTHWFTGTDGYVWNGTTWCEKTVYSQATDPSLVQPAPCGSYWYDTAEGSLFRWNDTIGLWTNTTAIQYHEDPNALTTGAYWFDETASQLKQWDGTVFTQITTVSIVETAPSSPATGRYWYNPATEELKQWNGTAWVDLNVLIFPVDPTVRSSCELWWNTDTDVLYVWDAVNLEWDAVSTFFQTDTDPTLPPTLVDGDLWFDGTVLYHWQNECFVEVEYISWPTDPTVIGNIPDGTVWFDGTNWSVMTAGSWVGIDPVQSANDPATLPAGTYWFNAGTLQYWNGVAWVNVAYSTSPFTPTTGTTWFDTTTDTLMVWSGEEWVAGTPRAIVELNCDGQMVFTDTSSGSTSFMQITDISLFSSLDVTFRLLDPSPGTDEVSSEPSYNELGIGTDGSNDERFKLMNEIRYEFGYPVIDVELTQEQLDYAITRALEELRGKTGIAYKTGFFFMRVNSETQRYYLTNKISGMNKIVNILGVFRLTSSFLSSAHGAGVYGQIVLQHLYNMGTFDLLSYHIMSEYTELMEILFAGRITYSWNEQSRELWIHHRFPFAERTVLIEASVERTEQDILVDRWCRSWIRRFATATAMEMLANIRGKFSTLPGAGGGITLNASDLRQKANEEKQALQQEIEDYIADRPDDYGAGGAGIMLG